MTWSNRPSNVTCCLKPGWFKQPPTENFVNQLDVSLQLRELPAPGPKRNGVFFSRVQSEASKNTTEGSVERSLGITFPNSD